MFLWSTKATMNDTESPNFWAGIPWIAEQTKIVEHINKTSCVGLCVVDEMCSAVEWFTKYDACVLALAPAHIDSSHNATQHIIQQKYPYTRPYLKKGHAVTTDHVKQWIERFVDEADCRLNKFRCADQTTHHHS